MVTALMQNRKRKAANESKTRNKLHRQKDVVAFTFKPQLIQLSVAITFIRINEILCFTMKEIMTNFNQKLKRIFLKQFMLCHQAL